MSKLENRIKEVHNTLALLNDRLDILIEKYEMDEDYDMCYLLMHHQKLLDTGRVIEQLKEVLEDSKEEN